MAVTEPGTLPSKGVRRDKSKGVKIGETGEERETTCKGSFSALCRNGPPIFRVQGSSAEPDFTSMNLGEPREARGQQRGCLITDHSPGQGLELG